MARNYMSMGAINCSTEGATHPVPSTRSKFWPSRITIQFCNQVILSVLSVSGLGIAQSQCGRDSGSLRIAMPSLRPCIFVLTSQRALNISGKKAAWSGTIFFLSSDQLRAASLIGRNAVTWLSIIEWRTIHDDQSSDIHMLNVKRRCKSNLVGSFLSLQQYNAVMGVLGLEGKVLRLVYVVSKSLLLAL